MLFFRVERIPRYWMDEFAANFWMWKEEKVE